MQLTADNNNNASLQSIYTPPADLCGEAERQLAEEFRVELPQTDYTSLQKCPLLGCALPPPTKAGAEVYFHN